MNVVMLWIEKVCSAYACNNDYDKKKTDAMQRESQVTASHHKYQVHFVIQCLYPKLCHFYPSLPGNKFSSWARLKKYL